MRAIRAMTATALALALVSAVPACRREAELGPPEIRYGDSVCIECDMIISDERFAAAILVEGPRGPEPRLFDDVGDLLDHEAAHPELRVVARYVHDADTKEWLDAARAHFLRSPDLQTPMASGIAAYADRAAAERARAEHGGEVLAFDGLR